MRRNSRRSQGIHSNLQEHERRIEYLYFNQEFSKPEIAKALKLSLYLMNQRISDIKKDRRIDTSTDPGLFLSIVQERGNVPLGLRLPTVNFLDVTDIQAKAHKGHKATDESPENLLLQDLAIIILISVGYRNQKIATLLDLSLPYVKYIFYRIIYKVTKTNNQTELARAFWGHNQEDRQLIVDKTETYASHRNISLVLPAALTFPVSTDPLSDNLPAFASPLLLLALVKKNGFVPATIAKSDIDFFDALKQKGAAITARELAILVLLVMGCKRSEIAGILSRATDYTGGLISDIGHKVGAQTHGQIAYFFWGQSQSNREQIVAGAREWLNVNSKPADFPDALTFPSAAPLEEPIRPDRFLNEARHVTPGGPGLGNRD